NSAFQMPLMLSDTFPTELNRGCSPRVARKAMRAMREGMVLVHTPVIVLPSFERSALIAESYQSKRIVTCEPSTSTPLVGTCSTPLTMTARPFEKRIVKGNSPPGDVRTARQVPSIDRDRG